MASRILPGLIVCFWLVMSFLLIRLEIDPDKSNLLTVPPAHVIKLMFMHEQISELNIMEDGKPVGNLMLHPKNDSDLNERTLVFTGGFSFRAPGAQKRQRISWDGKLVMDHTFAMRSLSLTASLQDPSYHLHLNIDPLTKRADYEIKQGTFPPLRSSIPLTQEGLSSLLRDDLGYDPAILQNMPVSVGSPTLSAKQTELVLHNEKIVAYLLTLKQGETTLAEIYVSQLGQILSAKTLIGYSLSTEETLP